MKIKLEYESDTLLPAEIMNDFNEMQRRILDNKYEPDKIICNVGWLRGKIIRWIDHNSIIEK
jgi:hypothetical protein